MTGKCLDADISVTPVAAPVQIYFDGALIGESQNALALAEGRYPIRYYLPRADINPEVLQPSAHTTHCPFKGDASYHHLNTGGTPAENAVWYYADPCPLVADVRDYLSFWGERVRVVLGD